MIIMILSLILFAVFSVLCGFHFYWFFGGTWGVEKVIPTQDNEQCAQSIPQFATLLVALVLVSFGLLYLIKSGLINVNLPNWITIYSYWIMPAIFIIRAIGEFKYVGFFKKIKNTEFAKADSTIFSPLCMSIGIIGIFIQLM